MSRSFQIAFCWMMLLALVVGIAVLGLLLFYGYAAFVLLGLAWGVHPLIAISIIAFLAMTVWSGYILSTR